MFMLDERCHQVSRMEVYKAIFKIEKVEKSFTVASTCDATMFSRTCERQRHASSLARVKCGQLGTTCAAARATAYG